MLGEVALNTIFLPSAERGVRKNNVHSVRGPIADVRPRQCVIVPHETRILDAVKEHVCDTQHVRQLLLLYGPKTPLHELLLLNLPHVSFSHVAESTGEKSSCATGGV